MRKLFNSVISKAAEEEIKRGYKGNLDTITEEEFKELKRELRDYDVIVDGFEYAIFVEDDLELICKLTDNHYNSKYFYKIEELGIYLSESYIEDGIYLAGDIGDSGEFMEFFLGDNEEDFATNLEELEWRNEDEVLVKAVEERIRLLKEDEEEKDIIELYVNDVMYCDVEEAIKEDEDYCNAEYEEVGYFSGEKIYRINDKLYYLSDDSYRFNTEHYFKLIEVSEKCYNRLNFK